jgi:hypothetical protein
MIATIAILLGALLFFAVRAVVILHDIRYAIVTLVNLKRGTP